MIMTSLVQGSKQLWASRSQIPHSLGVQHNYSCSWSSNKFDRWRVLEVSCKLRGSDLWCRLAFGWASNLALVSLASLVVLLTGQISKADSWGMTGCR